MDSLPAPDTTHLRSMAAELGISPADQCVRIVLWPGEPLRGEIHKWVTVRGLHLLTTLPFSWPDNPPPSDLVGCRVELYGRHFNAPPPGAPFWSLPVVDPDVGLNIFVLETWRRDVTRDNSPFTVRIDWRPTWSEQRASIHGGEHDRGASSDTLIEQARRTQRIMLGMKAVEIRRGKQPGDGVTWDSDHDFLVDLDEAAAAVTKGTGHKLPDAEAVRRKLSIGKTTFYENVKRATGRRWRDVAKGYAAGLRYAELNGIGRPQNSE